MKKIQMVDLIGQYEKIKTEVDAGIHQILSTAAYINGPDVKGFETELADYLNVKHVIGCANGTDALQICLMTLNLQPGDEVIIPNFTYVATAEVAALLRLKPVYADVDPDTFNLTAQTLERAITPRTKAVVPVHLFGQTSPMAEIMEICRQKNLTVIEDTAQSIGSLYTFPNGETAFAGTIGDMGSTSFYPSKNLSCYGDGGAMFTQNDETAANLRTIANHGQNRRYYFDKVGVNSRLDSIQAAVLRAKLRRLPEYTAARQQAARFYDAAFQDVAGLKTPYRAPYSTHVYHQYTLRVLDGKRDELQNYLTEKGIPSVVFYPLPIHQQTAYRSAEWQDEDFPNAVLLSQQVLSLPMHTELDDDQLSFIAETVRAFFRK